MIDPEILGMAAYKGWVDFEGGTFAPAWDDLDPHERRIARAVGAAVAATIERSCQLLADSDALALRAAEIAQLKATLFATVAAVDAIIEAQVKPVTQWREARRGATRFALWGGNE